MTRLIMVASIGAAVACLAACRVAPRPTPAPSLSSTEPPAPASAPVAGTTPTSRPLSALPLLFPVQSPEVAAYFNQIARADDVAMFPARYVSLMPHVVAGRRSVLFTSWAEAELQTDSVRDEIDIVVYDPEHWAETPVDEQRALTATVQRASGFVHTRGLRLLVAPDRAFAQAYLAQIAPDADLLMLQGQRLQNDSAALTSFTRSMVAAARARNPQVKIFLQIAATQPVPSGLVGLLEPLSPLIDGIAVWSLPRTLDTLQAIVAQIRS